MGDTTYDIRSSSSEGMTEGILDEYKVWDHIENH